MTFKQWRRKRVRCCDLGKALGDDLVHEEDATERGVLYPSGYIVERRKPQLGKRFYLIIERDEWKSDDLGELEPMLWDWVRMEWLQQPEHPVEALAEEFVRVLREWLSDAEWREMTKRNSSTHAAPICASHDFCDANMAMAEAFHNTLGRSLFPEGDSEPKARDIDLVNDAWSMARERHLAKVEG